MSSSNDSDTVSCPVCKKHSKTDAIGAQGLVIAAAKALISGDDSTVELASEHSDAYSFHMAVTLYVDLMDSYGMLIGMSVDEMLDDLRGQIDQAAANN